MILASIAFGIVTGIVSFAAALIAGQGLIVALGVYILGGIAGVVAMLAISGVRSLVRAPVRARDSFVAART
jgi:hypothetical protein